MSVCAFCVQGTEEVLSKMEAFNTSYNVHNEWQVRAEQTLQDSLPIEADLERLEEQQEILEVGSYMYCMYRDTVKPFYGGHPLCLFFEGL